MNRATLGVKLAQVGVDCGGGRNLAPLLVRDVVIVSSLLDAVETKDNTPYAIGLIVGLQAAER